MDGDRWYSWSLECSACGATHLAVYARRGNASADIYNGNRVTKAEMEVLYKQGPKGDPALLEEDAMTSFRRAAADASRLAPEILNGRKPKPEMRLL